MALLVCLISFTGWSQKAFLKQIGDQNRAYLFTSTGQNISDNNPLFIILHANQSKAFEAYKSDEIWKSIPSEANIVFPGGWEDTWSCKDSSQLGKDAQFIDEIISTAYSNFKIDRNRVYLIALPGSSCVGEFIKEQYPNSVSQIINLPANQSSPEQIVDEIERLIDAGKKTESSYSLYHPPVYDDNIDTMDILKKTTWHQRWVLGIHTGGLFILGSSRTETTAETYMDIADLHSFSGIELTKWMNDSMAWFLDISRLKIPMQQDIGSYTVTSGGGRLLVVTAGFKYQLVKNPFYKPYVMLGTGFMQLMVFGGKFSTVSQTMGSMDAAMRKLFHTTIGIGSDLRFGKRVVLGGQLKYIHSSQIKEAGSITAVRGFNINISASYILNANSEKNLKIFKKH